jgi:cell division protein FtsX
MRYILFRPSSAHTLLLSFLLAAVAALLLGLQQVLLTGERGLLGEMAAVVFLQTSVTDEEAKALEASFKERDPEIQSLILVSKESALQEAQQDPALAKSLMVLKENPLPASFTVQWSEKAWRTRSEPGVLIRELPQVQEIRWNPQAQSTFRLLTAWRTWLMRLSVAAVGLLVFWSFFGIVQFLARGSRVRVLIAKMGVGLVGGALGLLAWFGALHQLPNELISFRPQASLFVPLLIGVIVGLASFGWGETREQ